MRQLTAFILMTALVSQGFAAPQFITFNDGKLGVNFGGYHAAVGLGGLLGQNGGSGGGLFAEAGTPHGQSARAGLGGAVDANGGSSGGLYAGATAGRNIKASTGLAGGVTAEKSAGSGYASAQAGNHYAASGLGGDASGAAANGFTFSGTKSFGVSKGSVDSNSYQPSINKEHKEFDFDAANTVDFVPLAGKTSIDVQKEVSTPVIVKEVYVQSSPQITGKHSHKHSKPRHQFHKTAYVGGFIGGDGVAQVQPAIQKRIDTGVEATAGAGVAADAAVHGGTGQVYTKQVTFQRNPNFFADIFNIPISTLKAVGNFLGNTAGSTSVSVQKSGTVQADTDLITPKLGATSSVSQSDAHVSIQTPNVSKVIDDILAIPINTLGAVNKFLENNVPARKTVQVAEDGSIVPARVRLGPHARRRAAKQVILVQEETQKIEEKSS